MGQNLVVGLMAVFLVTPALADKPEWAGEGKPTAEQREAHGAAMQAKDEYGYEEDAGEKGKKEKAKKEKLKKEKKSRDDSDDQDDLDELKGLEKQADKKSIQEQKELGKGSETGQAAREERKKWWKFWE